MLGIFTWYWGNKYPPEDVHRLFRGINRHLTQPCELFVVTDQPHLFQEGGPVQTIEIEAPELFWTKTKGCFARMVAFNPEWQAKPQFSGITRFACMDLDSVVTGPLDAIFFRPESFAILQGANAANPCPYNGSLWMLRRGYRPDVYSTLDYNAVAAIPKYEFPDDQGWLWHKIPNAAGWHVGPRSGIYAFQKPGWPPGSDLPADARLVVFPGWRSPAQFYSSCPWIKENWL